MKSWIHIVAAIALLWVSGAGDAIARDGRQHLRPVPAAQRGPGPRTTPARAGTRRAPARKVGVRVMVVHATDAHSRIDPRLSTLTRYLKHLRFTGYDLLDTQKIQVGPKDTQSFGIVGGRKLSLTLLSRDERRARMRVQVTTGRGKLLDTTLSVNRNGTFIVAGPKYKGGVLVLPLTARY